MISSELKKYLENPENGYRIVPFWFLNHYPVEDELRRQIRDFAELNYGGVMVHPRDGLLAGYLNRHWEKTMSIILDEAKKRGLQVWLYDEMHYPSGIAGGLVREKFPDSVMQSLELVYESQEKPPENVDKLLLFHGRYLGFKIRRQEEYPDYLDDRAMAEFIRLSYTWYADRFKEDFGRVKFYLHSGKDIKVVATQNVRLPAKGALRVSSPVDLPELAVKFNVHLEVVNQEDQPVRISAVLPIENPWVDF